MITIHIKTTQQLNSLFKQIKNEIGPDEDFVIFVTYLLTIRTINQGIFYCDKIFDDKQKLKLITFCLLKILNKS